MANTIGEKELKTDWPVVTGITATAKHEGRISNLVPEGLHGVKTQVPERKRVGL